LPKAHAEHDVRGLAPDTGKRDELGKRLGHTAAEIGYDPLRQADEALRLLTKEPETADRFFDLRGRRIGQRRCVGPAREEDRRHLVDVDVGGLRAEHGSDQKLKWVHVLERALRVGVGRSESG
jgi:hypothetical protein